MQSDLTKTKIFGVGFHKTGTTSLFAALQLLDYKVSGTVGFELSYEQLTEQALALCLETAQKYDAVEDMPWPLYYKELDQAFPGSKFILTVRDLEKWYLSVSNHFSDHTPPMHSLIYGPDKAKAIAHKDHWIATHQAHIDAVLAYFATRPDDLLVMDFAQGDGWEKLCPFLGVTIPNTPFPQKNTSKSRKSLRYRLLRKWHHLTGRVFYPENAV
ncbi:MAG: sulfotransferase family protein [bacterium]